MTSHGRRAQIYHSDSFVVATLLVVVLVLSLHVLTNAFSPFGVHRDEFLYMAMGEHLRLFRMDFPPLIALLANASRVFGDSLVAIRITPAIAHASLVFIASLFVRRLGGQWFAFTLAMLSVALAPLFLRPGALFQPVIFDQLFWTAGYYALYRSLTEEQPGRWWIGFGAICGLALLCKFSIAFFGVGVLAGLLANARSTLRTRWPWLAALLALLIGSPSISGQLLLHFPVVGQMRDLNATQLERVTYAAFLFEQVLMFGPLIVLAIAGVILLLFYPPAHAWRTIGASSLCAFAVVMFLHGKAYYAGPVYPLWLAAGSVACERLTPIGRRYTYLVRASIIVVAVVFVLITLPIGLPILPPAQMARYAQQLGITQTTVTNRGVRLELPQDYADMLGWKEMVQKVAKIYNALPVEDRQRAVILADNYGRAGAVDFYGPALGLPRSVAPLGSYWYFGPGSLPGDVIIVIGSTQETLKQFFAEVSLAGEINEQWVVPEERHVGVFVARHPVRTLQDVWPQFEGRN